jgi:hypothetical protein
MQTVAISPSAVPTVLYSVFARTSKLTGRIKHQHYRLKGEKPVELALATAMVFVQVGLMSALRLLPHTPGQKRRSLCGRSANSWKAQFDGRSVA